MNKIKTTLKKNELSFFTKHTRQREKKRKIVKGRDSGTTQEYPPKPKQFAKDFQNLRNRSRQDKTALKKMNFLFFKKTYRILVDKQPREGTLPKPKKFAKDFQNLRNRSQQDKTALKKMNFLFSKKHIGSQQIEKKIVKQPREGTLPKPKKFAKDFKTYATEVISHQDKTALKKSTFLFQKKHVGCEQRG